MKNKIIVILMTFLLLISFSACNTFRTDESTQEITDPNEQNDGFDSEEERVDYPAVMEVETDFAEVDYSKFLFAPEPIYIYGDDELSIHNYSEAIQMMKAAEAQSLAFMSASNYDEALSLLNQVIEGSGDNRYKLMVAVSFKGLRGGYYVNTRFSEMYNLYPNTGEKKDLLFYSQQTIEYKTINGLLKSWERFTKYTNITSITFYTVPVVNVTE